MPKPDHPQPDAASAAPAAPPDALIETSPHEGQLVGAGGGATPAKRQLRNEPTLVVEAVGKGAGRRSLRISETAAGNLLITSLESGGYLCVAAEDRALLAQAILEIGRGAPDRPNPEAQSLAAVTGLLDELNAALARQGRNFTVRADRPDAEPRQPSPSLHQGSDR